MKLQKIIDLLRICVPLSTLLREKYQDLPCSSNFGYRSYINNYVHKDFICTLYKYGSGIGISLTNKTDNFIFIEICIKGTFRVDGRPFTYLKNGSLSIDNSVPDTFSVTKNEDNLWNKVHKTHEVIRCSDDDLELFEFNELLKNDTNLVTSSILIPKIGVLLCSTEYIEINLDVYNLVQEDLLDYLILEFTKTLSEIYNENKTV